MHSGYYGSLSPSATAMLLLLLLLLVSHCSSGVFVYSSEHSSSSCS
jgi:hypothetical protein